MFDSRIVLYVLLLPALLWLGCNCPPDEKEGDLDLGTEALAFLPYDQDSALTFMNEDGEELVLTLSRGEEVKREQLCVRTTCTEASFGSPSSCAFYEAESRRYTFFDAANTIALDVLLYSEVYDYGTAEFYDALQVGLSIGTPSTSARHLIEVRFPDPDPNITPIPLMELFEHRATLELNGKTFTDVLAFEDSTLSIYVQVGAGVIGFANAEHIWVLD